MALWLDIGPRAIASAQELGRYPIPQPAFAPVDRAVANQFVLDARDKDKTLPAPPRARPSVRGRYWNLYGQCV
jgi:hypothetical protein